MFLPICHTSICLPIDFLGLTVLCYHNNRSWSEGAIVNKCKVCKFYQLFLDEKPLRIRFGNNPRDKLNHFKEPSLDLSCILEFVIIFGPKCQNPAGSFWKRKRSFKVFRLKRLKDIFNEHRRTCGSKKLTLNLNHYCFWTLSLSL